jgi:cytoplasmic iron level regulating protein YaaA (DUF328/UPF0246 family)
MLVLLPPSEGKASEGTGPELDLRRLSLPELAEGRESVLDALITLCGSPDKASEVLGLGPTQAAEVETNRHLRTASTLPASDLFTGVLFDHLDLASLPPSQRRRATDCFLVFSGLFGVLRLDDRVPPHRLSMGVTLPGIGGLASYWRRALTPTLDALAADQLVVDLRSTPYTNAWKPPADRTVAVRVVTPDGRTVSHFNKATKGLVARAIAQSRATPPTAKRLRTLLLTAGFDVKLLPGAPAVLEVTTN